MPASARAFADIWVGICCCHVSPICVPMVGPIITGSLNTISGGSAQARFGDMTIGACGHPGVIVSSSIDHITNGPGSARIGDLVTGCNIGVIATGNPIHIIN